MYDISRGQHNIIVYYIGTRLNGRDENEYEIYYNRSVFPNLFVMATHKLLLVDNATHPYPDYKKIF